MVATVPPIEFQGERMSVHFTDFGIGSYPLFLRVKALPEYELQFVPETETYRITAPARFASLLGATPPVVPSEWLPLPDFLIDDQRAMVPLALRCKRFAYWARCGLGKTLVGLEFARQVVHRTAVNGVPGRVLIFTLNEIAPQWIEEGRKFYGDSLSILRLTSREQMKQWAAGTLVMPDESPVPSIAITNYEKMNYKADGDQVVNELRYLAGVVVDENRLKGGGRKQKWALIKSCKGIEYKLSLTATPAPNDTIEFASQASFLEKMRSDGEIIWTYFQRNEKTHRWEVKRHARKAFFEFLSGWSIYVNDPRRYGWRMNVAVEPAPTIIRHDLPMSTDQRAWLQKLSRDKSGQLSLIDRDDRNAIQRLRLSQIAKGFIYRKTTGGKRVTERIASAKPDFVANLICRDAAAGLQVLVWTVFDAESELIIEALRRLRRRPQFSTLHGSTPDYARLSVLEKFRHGEIPVLISKAELLGFGMNFQCCGSMIFSGFNDSYESFYQAVRRAVRFGQDKSVRVHLPLIEELEGDMLENLLIKQAKHEAAIADMEDNFLRAHHKLGQVAA